MKRIVILKDFCFPVDKYLISAIIPRWRNMGHEVIVTDFLQDNLPEADVAFLHIDQTEVPNSFFGRLSKYPVVLNHKVKDISKSRISNNILGPDDSYPGLVIIKTKANCGGIPEMQMKLAKQNVVGNIERRMTWKEVDVLDHRNYPILNNMNNVPFDVWNNSKLIVEKFIPEREGELFFLRYYIFLGQSEWASRFGAKEPVVHFSNMATEDLPVAIPEELQALRKKLGFDYGRFDYVIHNGKPVLFDVNKTIGGGRSPQLLEAYSDKLDYLAEGINTFC